MKGSGKEKTFSAFSLIDIWPQRTEQKSFSSCVLTVLKWDKSGPVHHAAGGEMVFAPLLFLCQFLEYRQDCFPCNALIFHLCSFCAEN